MFKKRQDRLYTKADINKAYSMGLEKAVVVLEASMLLSKADRWHIIELLKKRILEDKISAVKRHLKQSATKTFGHLNIG